MNTEKPPTPELDKQHEVIKTGKNLVVGEFLDWLEAQGYVLARYSEPDDDDYDGFQSDLYDTYDPKEKLIAGFFGIDLDKIEQERRALLEHIRSQQS